MVDLRQRKMMEVKGADHRLARRVIQEVDSCQKVLMAVMHEMARKAKKVEMADQTKLMEVKGADHHLTKTAALVHSKT